MAPPPPPSCTCFFLLGLQGAKPLAAPKNLHLTVPKTGSKLTKNTWMAMHFACELQYKVTGNFQKVQNFEFLSFYIRTNCVCFIFLAG